MPRPISWLPRLREIRQSVAHSVRSHYDRGDLQLLFQLQPRAASALLAILPSVAVRNVHMVAREDLAAFLKRVADADDVHAAIEETRSAKTVVSRKKLRRLVRRDLEEVPLSALPDTITLTRGNLTIRFERLEQLAEEMLLIAGLLDREPEEMAQAFEVIDLQDDEVDAGAVDMRSLFGELEELESFKGIDIRTCNIAAHRSIDGTMYYCRSCQRFVCTRDACMNAHKATCAADLTHPTRPEAA